MFKRLLSISPPPLLRSFTGSETVMKPETEQTEAVALVFTQETVVLRSYMNNGVNSVCLCSFGRENIQRMTGKFSLTTTKYKLLVYLVQHVYPGSRNLLFLTQSLKALETNYAVSFTSF